MRTDHQWRNSRVRKSETKDIKALESKGYKIKRITPYCFRINNSVDVFPTNRRFHVLKTGLRGTYAEVEALAQYYSNI